MEESKVRTMILEEIQGIINQTGEEISNDSDPAVAIRIIGAIIARRLNGVNIGKPVGGEEDRDTEIGKDSV